MKLLRVWVPDTKSAAFAAQAAEQAARLRVLVKYAIHNIRETNA
jgi:hypothetical protein